MYKSARNKFKVKLDARKELSKPKPISINIVLDNSRARIFDDAKLEWQLENAIDETSEGFTNVCGLCNNPHLKCNFVIRNPHTNSVLHVGSTCIIRFGLIEGNVDFESGAAIINNFVDEKFYLDAIRGMTNSLMVLRPDYVLLNEFLKMMRKYLDIKGIKNPTRNQLGEIAFGDRWLEVAKDNFKPHWLMTIWEKPYTIDAIKTKKATKLPVYKEGSTWGHKKRKGAFISDSFGRSEEYNVQKYVNDKNK